MLAGQSPSSALLKGGQSKSAQSNNFNNRKSVDARAGNQKQSESQITSKNQDYGKKSKKKRKQQTQFTSVLKIFNIIVGIVVVGFGVYCYIGVNTDEATKSTIDFVNLILPGYIAFSGLIILSVECHIKFIIRNMKFLYNYFGRGFFNIYVGILPLTLIKQGKDDKGKQQDPTFQIIIYIMVSLMCLIGLMYIIAKICCCAREGQKRKSRRADLSDSDSSDSD